MTHHDAVTGTSKYAVNPILLEANSLESGVLAKVSANSLTSGTAFQISSTGFNMRNDGSLLRVDANSQKLGRVVDIQANYLERGTALNVGSINWKLPVPFGYLPKEISSV